MTRAERHCLERRKERGLAAADADFEAFWAAYPSRRPNPRATARVAFDKAVVKRGVQPDDLIAAARAFALECARAEIDPKFIPHARTWLTQERYADYLQPAETGADHADPIHEPPALLGIAGEIGQVQYRAWIAPLRLRNPLCPRTVIVVCPSEAHRMWVKSHYAETLRRHLRRKPVFTLDERGE